MMIDEMLGDVPPMAEERPSRADVRDLVDERLNRPFDSAEAAEFDADAWAAKNAKASAHLGGPNDKWAATPVAG